MFRRLLIANRGEIALRVARTARRMGIDAIGVYSDADRTALHLGAMDFAVGLGGTSAAESYLQAERVIAAALEHGCDAVHPGYGFLSENEAFARSVIDAGMTWVGPPPEQIALLGDKVASKREAQAAGVPTTGFVVVAPGDVPEGLRYPVLVKAAAGGGGRGMRVVRDPADLQEALEACSREAASTFGDGSIFIEPYLERGRHVEVQIIGDAHGNVLHLGLRDCSIQRRNQKIIEECPPAGLDADLGRRLQDGALALARRVGYRNAGTVEFMVGDGGEVTFLEVNTRLQVEHPVTEAVTKLDLVELQFLVAAGHPIPFAQEDVRFEGHAIEARVVAERPHSGWAPATGRLRRFEFGDGVRVDSGVGPGSEVTTQYDSLLAKVISWAPTRAEAARRLERALRDGRVDGVQTNVTALCRILADGDFLAGATTTAYLDEHPEVVADHDPSDLDLDHIASLVAAVTVTQTAEVSASPWSFAPVGWRNVFTQGQRSSWVNESTGERHEIEYVAPAAGRARALVGSPPPILADGSLDRDSRRAFEVRVADVADGAVYVEIDGTTRRIQVARDGAHVDTSGPAGAVTWRSEPALAVHDATDLATDAVAPLPGTVTLVRVAAGDAVAPGDVLVVIEAMKMEHRVVTPLAATVAEVFVATGDRVDAGFVLLRYATDIGEEA
ncbi:MAG: biotin carboxylase N-terminal domain-containing protein [Microbacterium sp.]